MSTATNSKAAYDFVGFERRTLTREREDVQVRTKSRARTKSRTKVKSEVKA